jgi:hypothetical protein
MSDRDGGPAFGQVVELQCVRVEMDGSTQWEPALVESGMRLRDYFAAKAMAALITSSGTIPVNVTAADAYMYADAMLAARGRG